MSLDELPSGLMGGLTGLSWGAREGHDDGPRSDEPHGAHRRYWVYGSRPKLTAREGGLMAFRRRPRPESMALVLVGQPDGVLVTGQPGAVESAVARLLEVGGERARVASGIADLAAVAATASAFVAGQGQYVRLTARSMALLREHGLLPTDGGTFWGIVRDPKRIRGVLDFEKVDLGPQQMMALQTAAVSLALRAAIKEVQAAVERVENKVDAVLDLLRSDRLGDVLGTRRRLEPLVDRVRREGVISATDWSTVATIGTDVARDIEALRAYIRAQLQRADGGWRTGDRVSDAQRLFDKKGLLVESLALLLVAEHNLAAWHELRIAHVRVDEPSHLPWTIEDAQTAIKAELDDDQALVDAVRLVADRLTTPMALDGLAPWQRNALTTARLQLDDLAGWFADQRLLDITPLEAVAYPSPKQSLQHVGRSLSDLAGRTFDAARDRRRGRSQAAGELAAETPLQQGDRPAD